MPQVIARSKPGPKDQRVVLMVQWAFRIRGLKPRRDRHQEGVGRYIKALRHLDGLQGRQRWGGGVVQATSDRVIRGPASTRSSTPTHAAMPAVVNPTRRTGNKLRPARGFSQCRPPAGSSPPAGRRLAIHRCKRRQRGNDPRRTLAITTSPKATGQIDQPKARRVTAPGEQGQMASQPCGFSVTARPALGQCQPRQPFEPHARAVSRYQPTSKMVAPCNSVLRS